MAIGERIPCPRGWSVGTSIAFPIAALVAAAATFFNAPLIPEVVIGLLVALVPWALLAGLGRMPTWLMIVWVVPAVALAASDIDSLGALMVLVALVAWVASEESRRWPVVIAFASSSLVALWACQDDKHNGWIYFTSGYAFAWFAGAMLRRERGLLAELHRSQAAANQSALLTERQKMARDIHDIVGHSLTVMMLNVGGARRHLERNPQAADEALARAEQVGRQSLDHVRQVVGLLRDHDGTANHAPLPSATDIERLIGDARAAGMAVAFDVTGDLDGVDPATGLAAYRTVQEALTNADHHAPGTPVSVRVRADGDRLRLVVRNPLPRDRDRNRRPAGGGFGLTGLRERVESSGGTTSAGPSPAGEWVVECELPLPAAR